MKKLALTVLVSASISAYAEEGKVVEHVLVTVPLHKKESETALPVTILSGDALKRAAGNSIGDTLAQQPGLNNASFGPGVGQPVIRGQQGARVTVLQNGTVSADASNLSADHAVAVESLLADSIEVLRGPATLLYGGGAIGGVVNVIDGRIPTTLVGDTEVAVETRYDSVNAGKTGVVRIDSSSGDLAFHFDAVVKRWGDLDVPNGSAAPLHQEEEHEDHEDHAEDDHGEHDEHEEYEGPLNRLANTSGDTEIFTVGMSRHFEGGFMGFSVQRQESDYGIPAGAHSHGHDEHGDEHGDEQGDEHGDEHLDEHDDHGHDEMAESPEDGIRIQLEQTRYDFAFHRHEPVPGVKELRSFFAYTDYEHAEVEPNGEVGTTYSNRSHQLRVELVHQDVGAWHGVVGLQVGGSKFSALGEEAFIPVTKSDQMGLFWLEDLHLADSMLELGVRLDRDERNPQSAGAPGESFTSFSASAAWVKPLSSGWQLSAAVSRAERAPAIEELYSNYGLTDPETWVVHAATEAIEIGSAELDTEVSTNLDLSVSRSWGTHFIEGVVYYNAFSDYIGLVADQEVGEVDGVSVLRYNQQDADFYGAELSSYWGLGEVLDGDLALEVNADFIRGEFSGSLGNVPRMPADRLFLKAEWRGDRVYAWSRVTHAFEQDRVATAEEATESYTRWDLGAEWTVDAGQQWTVFASLNNVTDEEIRFSTSFLKDIAPEAGRGIEIGFRGAF